MGEGFCRPARQKIAGILGVFQDFLTQQDGKRPVQAVCGEILNRLLGTKGRSSLGHQAGPLFGFCQPGNCDEIWKKIAIDFQAASPYSEGRIPLLCKRRWFS